PGADYAAQPQHWGKPASKPWHSAEQHRCEVGKAGQQVEAIRRDELDADVVGAGVEVFGDPCTDLACVAERHQVAAEAIAARPGDVVVGEPEAAPVAGVVGLREVVTQGGASELAGPGEVAVEHGVLLGGK